MTSMITATSWVPRGHAAAYPTKYVFDEGEYARISKLAKLELEDAKEDLETARKELAKSSISAGGPVQSAGAVTKEEEADEADHEDEDDDLKEYDMEHYDDDGDNMVESEDEGEHGNESGLFGNVKSLAYHADSEDDPYITLQGNQDSDDEDREDLQILPTDNMLLAARVEDEVAHLEVYVYEDSQDNLYVHHDVMLPAIPLCVEWLGAKPNHAGESGNFAAVGTMEPDIELWDLDVVDGMYPFAILGQSSEPTPPTMPERKKKKSRSLKSNTSYHVDAVLSLSANRHNPTLLASASADKTVKLWDLTTCTAAQSYSHHTDKVCTLAWHPTQPAVLLSGSYDRTIVAADMRAPDAKVPRWGVESDVENVKWDSHNDSLFYVSTENGILHCFDVRQLPPTPEQSKASWRLQAHEKSLSSFSINPAIPGMIATGSTDRSCKIWNILSSGPSLVVSRDLGVGKVFSTNFAPDDAVAFRLAVAGSKGSVQVWDTSTNRAVREAFATRGKLPKIEGEVKERLVGVEADDEEAEEEEEARQAEEGGGEAGGWESMEEE
ncbi:hypothetical protein B0A48_13793 [Cryoendolithus antarcticus]|uniref:Uncharacterized protein n=1 Tax=Cryoendolithus antarcticus TaxID=1507870 RepID=A0A1V8SMZ5_9PEZI|nr:hypothetical protein B0A48_13793 [Cryoendolithus antarcticus]